MFDPLKIFKYLLTIIFCLVTFNLIAIFYRYVLNGERALPLIRLNPRNIVVDRSKTTHLDLLNIIYKLYDFLPSGNGYQVRLLLNLLEIFFVRT